VTPRTVVVGYDGSADAQHAIDWAARTAGALGADLCIVHAVGLLEHAGLAGAAAIDGAPARARATEAGLDGSRVDWRVEDGDPCTALLRAAERAQGEGATVLLVVGSRGSGGHTGTLLGSTSLELAEHAHVPVTIVPPPRDPRRREA
jgi:nucleotide-binding universal stress UspA family protein